MQVLFYACAFQNYGQHIQNGKNPRELSSVALDLVYQGLGTQISESNDELLLS